MLARPSKTGHRPCGSARRRRSASRLGRYPHGRSWSTSFRWTAVNLGHYDRWAPLHPADQFDQRPVVGATQHQVRDQSTAGPADHWPRRHRQLLTAGHAVVERHGGDDDYRHCRANRSNVQKEDSPVKAKICGTLPFQFTRQGLHTRCSSQSPHNRQRPRYPVVT